ncbi:MAG: alpha/beta hydrolase family protein [Hyphomonas sp.]
MGKFSNLAAALTAGLLTACASSLPELLPELPALAMPAIPGFAAGPVAGDPACGGSWRLEDGGGIALTPTEEGLRWRTLEGETGRFVFEKETWQAYSGWTDQPETRQMEFTCQTGLSVFEGAVATATEVVTQETVFAGAKGTQLAGRLILPAGDGPVPVVVQVQGSGRYSALQHDPFQHLLPLQGVGVFIYDKRGTGVSKGSYTQDFGVLATDAAAAATEARRLAGARLGRFGLHGASQGGWVAPLAARTVKPGFVIVSYGLLESPLAENRAQTVQDVAEAGFGPSAQMAAGMLADAAGAIMVSDFKSGYFELEALKNIYRNEPWYPYVKGEFTGEILQHSDVVLRVAGPLRSVGTSWRHEGEPVLLGIHAPVLWILAGEDRDAPPAYTRSRLKTLQFEGRPITLAEYPGYDHGMRGFDILPDGTRQFTHIAPGYVRMVADFALETPIAPGYYGEAMISGPAEPR